MERVTSADRAELAAREVARAGGDGASGEALMAVYRRPLDEFGPQGWWPAETAFEMVVGAILTQNTAWVNVARAIDNLRDAGALEAEAMAAMGAERLAELIRPSGYFNVKAQKLIRFLEFLNGSYGGDLAKLFHVKQPELRAQLLSIWGIGKETADSIVLYGAHQPIFVVDAYTCRLFARLGLIRPEAGYDELQRLFMENLPPDLNLFQEYHALIVALGKDVCRPTPRCSLCPLLELCPTGRAGTPGNGKASDGGGIAKGATRVGGS